MVSSVTFRMSNGLPLPRRCMCSLLLRYLGTFRSISAQENFDLHALAEIPFANDKVASRRVTPVHRVETSISALPSEFGIVVCPVLGCKSLLPFNEFGGLTLDELSLTFDWAKGRSRSHARHERGNGQEEFVESNHDGKVIELRL